MSSVDDLVAPTVPAGTGLVNAQALDAQFRTLVDQINALIAALGRSREATRNELADRSVRWRMVAETTRTQIQHIVGLVRELRDTFTTTINTPLGGGPVIPGTAGSIAPLAAVEGIAGSRSVEIVCPGQPGIGYRMRFRFRCNSEACAVRDTGMSSSQYYSSPLAVPPRPVPADVFVNGRIFYSEARTILPAPSEYDSVTLTIARTGSPDKRYILNGVIPDSNTPTGTGGIMQSALAIGWKIDTTLENFLAAGDTLAFAYSNPDNRSTMSLGTDMPADDDPRFPYEARYRDPTGIQFDVIEYRPVDINREPTIILTQLGGWLETDGPGGFLEIQ